jgi:hypothetical protein
MIVTRETVCALFGGGALLIIGAMAAFEPSLLTALCHPLPDRPNTALIKFGFVGNWAANSAQPPTPLKVDPPFGALRPNLPRHG